MTLIMGRDDPAPFGNADPARRLTADLALRAVPTEQSGGAGAVAGSSSRPFLELPDGHSDTLEEDPLERDHVA
jgi:hypothetical protein